MRWLPIAAAVVAAVVVLIAIVLAIGALLPVKHTAERSADLPAPPERVWAALTDVGAFPSWRPRVSQVTILAPHDGHTVWREQGADGAITFEMVSTAPPTRLVTQITDRTLPFGGRWEYDIAVTKPGATRLTITEYGEVYNPVFRFVSRYVMGYHATIDAYLTALAAHLGAATQYTR